MRALLYYGRKWKHISSFVAMNKGNPLHLYVSHRIMENDSAALLPSSPRSLTLSLTLFSLHFMLSRIHRSSLPSQSVNSCYGAHAQHCAHTVGRSNERARALPTFPRWIRDKSTFCTKTHQDDNLVGMQSGTLGNELFIGGYQAE